MTINTDFKRGFVTAMAMRSFANIVMKNPMLMFVMDDKAKNDVISALLVSIGLEPFTEQDGKEADKMLKELDNGLSNVLAAKLREALEKN